MFPGGKQFGGIISVLSAHVSLDVLCVHFIVTALCVGVASACWQSVCDEDIRWALVAVAASTIFSVSVELFDDDDDDGQQQQMMSRKWQIINLLARCSAMFTFIFAQLVFYRSSRSGCDATLYYVGLGIVIYLWLLNAAKLLRYCCRSCARKVNVAVTSKSSF